jgi:hypothetical protein
MNTLSNHKAILQQAQERAGNYFFWIAGFSVVNAVLIFFKSRITSALSLGVVDIINYMFPGGMTAVIVTAIMVGIFAAFGVFSRKGSIVAFVIGMVLYAFDIIPLFFGSLWISIAVHAYLLYQLYRGITYSLALKKMIKQEEDDIRRQRVAQAAPGQPYR